MARKLDIIVTHYKEPFATCKILFDSLALQQGIDFNDFGVIVVNDGREVLLDADVLKQYPYKIEYKIKAQGGVSAARNFGMDHSKAEYVMFCDCDDSFLNNYGLHLVFSAIQNGFETLSSPFVEEVKDEDGVMHIVRHDKDHTFIHGKVHNRDFLVKNNIRFDDELTIHEDGYFNCLVHSIAEKHQYLETPFYLWKWNENSVVRSNRKMFVMRTYKNLIDSRIKMTRQFFERGMISQAIDCVIKSTFDAYYDLNKPEWMLEENKELYKQAEKEYARYYKEFGEHYHEANITRIAELSFSCRATAYKNGFMIEKFTISEFLNHIKSTYLCD